MNQEWATVVGRPVPSLDPLRADGHEGGPWFPEGNCFHDLRHLPGLPIVEGDQLVSVHAVAKADGMVPQGIDPNRVVRATLETARDRDRLKFGRIGPSSFARIC